MNIGSGSGCWKSGDVLPEEFPVGLRVLVVDDDLTCLAIMKKMLWKCHYQVTACNAAEVALSILREKKNGFDIVISDVHMPDMDGFKLLEHIGLEMDLPVIMMSADDSKHVVMEGVTHGAYDYLIKPVQIEALKNIWQHIVRKKRRELKESEGDRQQKPSEDVDNSSSNSKKRKEEEEEAEERDDTSPKKPRVVWCMELHQQFLRAVRQLGNDKAVPKKILELMNVPGLTRENVASHLQKYRLYLRRVSSESQHQNGLNNSFMGCADTNLASSFNGLDLQAIATAGHIPTQGLATLGRCASKSMPLVDQRHLFSSENSSGQQLNSSNNLTQLLHGIPTTMPQYNNSVLMRMPQAQPGANNGSQVSRLQLSMQQSLSSEGIVLAQSHIVDNARGRVYNTVSQQPSMVDLLVIEACLTNRSGMSTLTNRGMLQEEANSDIKGSRGFPSNYDIVNQLHQPKLQNWGLQNVGSTFGTYHHPSIQGAQGVSSSGHVGGSQLNSVGGNMLAVTAERFRGADHQSTNFLEQFGEDNLMSVFLKQQGNVGPVQTEFGFDGYPPV